MYDRVKGNGSYIGTAIGVTEVLIGPINYVGRFVTVHEHHAKRFLPDTDSESIERIFYEDCMLTSDIKISSLDSVDDFFADMFILRPSRRLDDAYSRLSAFCDAYITEYGCQPEYTTLDKTPIEDIDNVMRERFLLPLRRGKDVGGEFTDYTEGTFASNLTQSLIRTRKPSKGIIRDYVSFIKAVKSENYEDAARRRDKLHSKLR